MFGSKVVDKCAQCTSPAHLAAFGTIQQQEHRDTRPRAGQHSMCVSPCSSPLKLLPHIPGAPNCSHPARPLTPTANLCYQAGRPGALLQPASSARKVLNLSRLDEAFGCLCVSTEKWWNDREIGKTKARGDKLVPLPHSPPQIPHRLASYHSRFAEVRYRR
jgi:hypothetical protein